MRHPLHPTPFRVVELEDEALASVSGGFTPEYPCGNDILFKFKGKFPGPRPVLEVENLAAVSLLRA